jgi:hypothetical protein
VGGNDAGFSKIIATCIAFAACSSTVVAPDTQGLEIATTNRIAGKVGPSVLTVLEQIHLRAPNAKILLMGYPDLFESGGGCISIANNQTPWLQQTSANLGAALQLAASQLNAAPGPDYVVYGDTTSAFHSRNLCAPDGYINRFVLPVTKGDDPIVRLFGSNAGIVSAQSVHPNKLGAGAYADLMESTLGW